MAHINDVSAPNEHSFWVNINYFLCVVVSWRWKQLLDIHCYSFIHVWNWIPQELDIENDDADAFGGSQYSEGDAVMLAAEDEGEERLREAAISSSVRCARWIT